MQIRSPDVVVGIPRSLSGRTAGFARPSQILINGFNLWVASTIGDSVTEIDTRTGAAQTYAGRRYGFGDPSALAAAGAGVWIASVDSNSVTGLQPG